MQHKIIEKRSKPGVAVRRLQKPMTLGHSHASMAMTLAYRVLSPAVGVRGRRREISVILSGLRPSRMTAGMTFG